MSPSPSGVVWVARYAYQKATGIFCGSETDWALQPKRKSPIHTVFRTSAKIVASTVQHIVPKLFQRLNEILKSTVVHRKASRSSLYATGNVPSVGAGTTSKAGTTSEIVPWIVFDCSTIYTLNLVADTRLMAFYGRPSSRNVRFLYDSLWLYTRSILP